MATVVAVRHDAGASIADVRTPAHDPGAVDVELSNVDASGAAIPGEWVVAPDAYGFLRPRLAQESDLTRVVRELLRNLKRQLVQNVGSTVSVDFDDTPEDGLRVIALATLPSVVVSGPTIREDRFHSTNVIHERMLPGPEVERRRPPLTVDLAFTITVASERTAELLNLMAAVATFLNRNRWLLLPRDPTFPDGEMVRWEMDPDGELRTDRPGRDDVRAFSWGFVVRGFDIDEGLPLERSRVVEEVELGSVSLDVPLGRKSR
jgi:hypothetical protein